MMFINHGTDLSVIFAKILKTAKTSQEINNFGRTASDKPSDFILLFGNKTNKSINFLINGGKKLFGHSNVISQPWRECVQLIFPFR